MVGGIILLPNHRFILLHKKVLRRCISIKKHQHKREEKVNKGFDTVVFTISLFISPDLDGHRAQGTPTEALTLDMFHDMFVH